MESIFDLLQSVVSATQAGGCGASDLVQTPQIRWSPALLLLVRDPRPEGAACCCSSWLDSTNTIIAFPLYTWGGAEMATSAALDSQELSRSWKPEKHDQVQQLLRESAILSVQTPKLATEDSHGRRRRLLPGWESFREGTKAQM